MKLGFIGTGNITVAVVTGICRSKISYKKILVSSRNKSKALKLSKKFKKVSIAKTNQEIVDKCNWIFLAVTPKVGVKIIPKLEFRSNQKIISFISTIKLAQLKKFIKKKIKIVRAIPLPPISIGKGPVPICPPDKQTKSFFDKIGTTIEIKNEKSSNNFWSMSGMMAPFYEMLKVKSDWLVKRGINRDKAQKYITSLFVALSEDSAIKSEKHLKYLVAESQTPGGLNEQGVKELRKSGYYRSLEKSLNSILKRLNKV
ncbi:pyrroline-5-carboxylate reductase [Pelagibacteraceae bacterium]|nr:pyrroline-5-carboxylate reductase [Pelagibacteraceae bacterium]